MVATLFAESDEWRRDALTRWARLYDEAPRACGEFTQFLQLVRIRGGLDRYYSSAERMSSVDMVDVDALDQLGAEHAGAPLSAVLFALEHKQRLLAAVEDTDGNAIELTTIHGANGREWKNVVIFGAEDDQLPHRRAIVDAGDDPSAIESAIEDERRLAYVAMTRASERLVVVALRDNPSRFFAEAGLRQTLPTESVTGA